MVNTEIRLIIFFAAKDGEALYSQHKQDWELTVIQIMNSLLPSSDLNSRKYGKSQTIQVLPKSNNLGLYSGSDLKEAEDIKKRWQEYTEKLYKKGLNDLHNHDSVITHLEPDILECEVKRALGSITTNKASLDD